MDFKSNAVIVARDLTISAPQGKEIVRDLSLSINPGDRLAIIGSEGVGKSTLLKVFLGETLPNFSISGSVSSGNAGYLAQHTESKWKNSTPSVFLLSGDTPLADEDLDWEKYTVACRALADVGLTTAMLETSQTLDRLSGGEAVRVRLAKVLLTEPDIILLDEPTNYLDLATISWLEDFLLNRKEAVAFVTHDETLIERVANKILFIQHFDHLNKSRHLFSGTDYDEFLSQKEAEYERVETEARKQKSALKKIKRAYVEAASKSASKTKKASASAEGAAEKSRAMRASQQSTNRLVRLKEKMEDLSQIESLDREDNVLVDFSQHASIPSGKVVLDVQNMFVLCGETVLAKNVDLKIIGPQKVIIMGENGVGKSTLLRQLENEILKDSTIRSASLPQKPSDVLVDPNRKATTYLDDINADTTFNRIILGRLGFHRSQMEMKVSKLSGGQKIKLLLARLICSQANVLLLDEPTTNLSPISSPNLRAALKVFPGAVIAVSHDRKFIEEVGTELYELTPRGLRKRSSFQIPTP